MHVVEVSFVATSTKKNSKLYHATTINTNDWALVANTVIFVSSTLI